MKIAAAAYPLELFGRWNEYVGKIRVWVRTAVESGAELLVFPEYGAIQVAGLAGEVIAGDLQQSIDAITTRLKDVNDFHSSLAREFGVHICAGSAPVRVEGRALNRSRLFAPDGSHGAQDKLILTRFEREEWRIDPGSEARVFDTALGRIGILLCYDAEFPLIARAMAEAGAEILLVPSQTDTMHGYSRVRIAAMARALENQCIAVHACIVGDVDWSAAIERSVGAAGIYGPPDTGFPETGVIAMGKMNEPGWVYGDVDLAAVRDVRSEGAVRNFQHWPEQADGRLAKVETLRLGQPAPAA